MKFVAALVTLLLLQAPTAPQQGANGVLEGIVVRAGSGEPVVGARVQWTSSLDPPNLFNGPNPNPAGITGSDGRFSFKDLKPATYRIAVTATGYVRQEYGQVGLSGTARSVYLGAGQTIKELSFSLIPSATVSGRVLEENGQPAAETLVQLVEELYSAQGRSFRGAGMANADDRGEFRMFGVTPGRYYLVAGSVNVLQSVQPGEGDVISVSTSRINYAPSFYPGVPEMSAASIIELKPGSETRSDFVVKRQTGFRVSGQVLDSATGQPASNARISLSTLYNPTAAVQPMLYGMRNTGTGPGVFEFLNVPPGEWLVRAEVPIPAQPGPPDPATASARNAAQASRPLGTARARITNAPVDGLTVRLETGFSVPARIVVDGGSLNQLANSDRISLRFQPSENGALTQAVVGAATPASSRQGPDGAVQIDGVRPGEFLMSVISVPPGYYVRSAKYGSQDVLIGPIRFSSPGSDAIEVILHAGSGQISGTVTDSKSLQVSGIQVVLIPDESRRHRSDLYKTVLTDQSGHFTIVNIAPGDYKIFSWEALQQGNFYSPAVMKQFESQGRAIHVAESSNENVDVKMIPAVQ